MVCPRVLTFGTLWHPLVWSGFWYGSFWFFPVIHHSLLMSATCNLFSYFFLTAQHSAPYVIVGLIPVSYTLSFRLMCTCLSHSRPVSCLHFIKASLTRLLKPPSSHMTRSSANGMAQGGSVSISEASTSMMMMKSRGLIANPWCSPTFTLKYSVFPSLVVTRVWQSSYISWMILMYASGTLFFRRLHHISSLCTRSYAFSRSTKTMWNSLFFSLYFSCCILNANIGSVVDLPGLNPNWLSAILV